VIPVCVRQQKGETMILVCQQVMTRFANAGTGIHDQNLIIVRPDLQAGGIATVSQIWFTGNRYRTS